jgi:hypothetical protein
MNAKRHESNKCLAAGIIKIGSSPDESRDLSTAGPVRRSDHCRANAVLTIEKER